MPFGGRGDIADVFCWYMLGSCVTIETDNQMSEILILAWFFVGGKIWLMESSR